MLAVMAVIFGGLFGAVWGGAFGAVIGAAVVWLLQRSLQQDRLIAGLQATLKTLQAERVAARSPTRPQQSFASSVVEGEYRNSIRALLIDLRFDLRNGRPSRALFCSSCAGQALQAERPG